jgi:hypothetical protein
MPTVHQILRQSGFSDAEISSLDARASAAFTNILSTAERERQDAVTAREAAERQNLANRDWWESTVTPGLETWDAEKTRLASAMTNAEAEVAYYKTLIEKAKGEGFVPRDAPSFEPGGHYTAGQTGSPTFVDPNTLIARAGDGFNTIADINWKYQSLYGSPLPIPPSKLIAQADGMKLSPMEYAARTFKFAEKEAVIAEQKQKERDDQIRAAAAAERDKVWAERYSNGGPVGTARQSAMSEVSRATREGTRPDPLLQNDFQRRQTTRQQIHERIAEMQENSV